MSEDMENRVKMLGFSGAKRFFPYDEGQEVGDFYLVMAPAGEEQAGFFDDMDLFDMDKEEEGLLPAGQVRGWLRGRMEGVYDEELTNPIKHYIKEMGGVGLLTREGEKEIAMRIEEAKEEIREILLSFPGTVKELLNVYSSLKMSELSLSEIAAEAEDEEETGEEDARRKGSSTSWRRCRRPTSGRRRLRSGEEKRRCRAEMRQIVGDISFSRKIVERIKHRMRTLSRGSRRSRERSSG